MEKMGRNGIVVFMKKNEYNIFDMIPERIRDSEKQSDQKVHVLYPRFPCWPFRWLMKYTKQPFIHLKLDEIGSVIWETIDGKKTVLDISQEVAGILEQEITEVWHNRIAAFMQYLQRGDLVKLKAKNLQ